jgi:hypothetical protein
MAQEITKEAEHFKPFFKYIIRVKVNFLITEICGIIELDKIPVPN